MILDLGGRQVHPGRQASQAQEGGKVARGHQGVEGYEAVQAQEEGKASLGH